MTLLKGAHARLFIATNAYLQPGKKLMLVGSDPSDQTKHVPIGEVLSSGSGVVCLGLANTAPARAAAAAIRDGLLDQTRARGSQAYYVEATNLYGGEAFKYLVVRL